jgi:hypothetical protein
MENLDRITQGSTRTRNIATRDEAMLGRLPEDHAQTEKRSEMTIRRKAISLE